LRGTEGVELYSPGVKEGELENSSKRFQYVISSVFCTTRCIPGFSGVQIYYVSYLFSHINRFTYQPDLGPWLIQRLRQYKVGQNIREEGPKTHFQKPDPDYGGLLILIAIFVSTLLWADFSNEHIWIVMLSTAGFGIIGFIDDYLKLVKKRSMGLRGNIN
jgi:phospho-N-acetylmuramoyl-pentapeptide-transferase